MSDTPPPSPPAGLPAGGHPARGGPGDVFEEVLALLTPDRLLRDPRATGEGVSAQAREVYELVRSAQEEGVRQARPGPTGVELDRHVRALIERAGHGEHYGHGLGHGVGMDIHEGPRLSQSGSREPLRAGNVVTIEPGVYVPDVVGVRIEDLVVLTGDGCDVLTKLPKELTVVC